MGKLLTCPASEYAAAETLALSIYPELTDAMLAKGWSRP